MLSIVVLSVDVSHRYMLLKYVNGYQKNENVVKVLNFKFQENGSNPKNFVFKQGLMALTNRKVLVVGVSTSKTIIFHK